MGRILSRGFMMFLAVAAALPASTTEIVSSAEAQVVVTPPPGRDRDRGRPGRGRRPNPPPVVVVPPPARRPVQPVQPPYYPPTQPPYYPPADPNPGYPPPSYGRPTRHDCYNPRRAGYRGMQTGVRNAQRLFRMAMDRVGGTCNSLEYVANVIADTPLAPPQGGGEFAACYYVGYTDTLWAELGSAFDRCGQICFNAGAAIGEISAQAYCAVSMALGGLYDPGFIAPPPARLFCDYTLRFGCKVAYVQEATSRIPGCYAYTTGSFSMTFENMVRQDCYVEPGVPIRDPYYPIGSMLN